MKPSQSNATRGGRAFAGGLTLAAIALALAGCASSAGIAPTARALSAKAVGLPSASASADTLPLLSAPWWRSWGDAPLADLIDRALAANPSLAVAQDRLARASAAVAGEAAAAGPKLGASADVTRQRFSATSVYPAPLGGSIRTLANAQLAGSWEIDFFGRQQAAMRAALGSARAAQADVAAARNLLASQVAQTYVQLARLVAQREVARQSLAQRGALLGLTRERVDAGLDSQVELRQSEGALPDARAQIEQLSEQIALARHALAALAAQPPETHATLTPSLDSLRAVALPASLPADLLGRRADIAAARWRVEAATQDVAVARARFYPNVNLSAFVGLSSIGLDRLVESGSRQYGVGPAIHLPIFDSGALRANLRGKTAEVDAAVDSYNGALVEAVREVADALQSLQSIARQQTEQAQAQTATDAAFDFATQRYRAGLSNQLTLLNAETAMLFQRRAAVDLRARSLSTQAALIRALGGGYANELSLPVSAAQRD
jgi:NodT family efflux transporter outer membrane factor (OMF) lipoprotein